MVELLIEGSRVSHVVVYLDSIYSALVCKADWKGFKEKSAPVDDFAPKLGDALETVHIMADTPFPALCATFADAHNKANLVV
jgi:hypothetical protein